MRPSELRPAAGHGGRGAGDLASRPDQPSSYSNSAAAAITEARADLIGHVPTVEMVNRLADEIAAEASVRYGVRLRWVG